MTATVQWIDDTNVEVDPLRVTATLHMKSTKGREFTQRISFDLYDIGRLTTLGYNAISEARVQLNRFECIAQGANRNDK